MSLARELFERYHLAIFRFLRRMTRSREVAEDLLQEVFLRVVRSESRFRREGTDRAWVFRIARNVLLNHRRDESRRDAGAPLDESGAGAPPARLVERLSLEEALGRLDETGREVFLLREVGGLGYREISSVCGLSDDAVRNRIYRARCDLRRLLARTLSGRAGEFRQGRTS
jgi:RNA polymerase sigma-70 factor (ECF subfamily)